MTQAENGATLDKICKMIQALQREEMVQMQRTHSDALGQIVAVARQHDLTAEHITFVEPYNVKISTDVSGYNRQFNIRSETSTCLNLMGTFIDR
jgi:hypothetical protein